MCNSKFKSAPLNRFLSKKPPGLVVLRRFLQPNRLLFGLCLGLTSLASQSDQACGLQGEAHKIYGANPIVSYLIQAVAPQKLVGWNFPPPPQAKGIFADDAFAKPVIGGWFGQGRTPNMEELLAARPDLILMSGAMVNPQRQQMLQKLGLPVCHLKLERLEDYPQDLRNLGRWSGQTQRGETLAQAMESLMQTQQTYLKQIKATGLKPKTVYYAESPSGLATECRGSIHAETLPWAGAINPHICPADQGKQSRYGMVQINFEQLLQYDPDAIVTQEKAFYDRVYQDPKWQALKAVKNRQVFFAPQTPFRWLDRPPSFMRLLAAQWLMQKLYPELVQQNLTQRTQQFFQTFFQVDLTEKQAEQILQGGTL